MSNTYYTSLSGMMAASYGLQNTSNNVANMQSAGFKRNDVFYSSLGNGESHQGLGSGVCIGGQNTNFAAGNYLPTGNPSDLAIVGNGFFIVQLKNGEQLYTRSGEFSFNEEGLLADKHSGGLVQGYDQQGNLVAISQFGPKTNKGQATHSIDIKGEFVVAALEEDSNIPNPDPNKSKYESVELSVTIFDEKGRQHTVKCRFEASNLPGESDGKHWRLTAADCNDAVITFDEQTLAFDMERDGAAASTGMNTIQFTVNDKQNVQLNFGDYTTEAESSVRLYTKEKALHPRSTLEEKKQDGYGFGKQIDFSFDDNGQISYKYDNGQSEEGLHVALAVFEEMEHTLIPAHDSLFRAKNTHGLRIGRPNKDNFGTIQPKKLENSNVDPTTEFAHIVVLQRMFQACSQIMDIDKQLLEELYKK